MKLSAPTQPVWWIAVIAGFLGILSEFVTIPEISPNRFWLVAIGFFLLFLGTTFKKI